VTITCVRETPTAREAPTGYEHIYEAEVARRWFALPPGVLLPLSNGETCRLLFAGHTGSAAGPDVLDAVIHFPWQEMQCVGAVEFHVRASDWYHHQHQSDARYNNVILHVVLVCDEPSLAVRQDGKTIPMCSLNDLAQPRRSYLRMEWPCQQVTPQLGEQERGRLLRQAGLLRFEQKAHAFVELLHAGYAQDPFSAYDVCLITALAEGLGYGRDRAFFRAAGRYLLGLESAMPEPLGRTFDPSPLDRGRLQVLRRLVEQWRVHGAWQSLRKIVCVAADQQVIAANCAEKIDAAERDFLEGRMSDLDRPERGKGLQALRGIFQGLGTARADILICNVVLPFATAVALIEHDTVLAEEAAALYTEYPGLSSNRITRAMCEQLQLTREPKGACEQQGLHYIYQQTCQEKRCEVCMMGERAV
jgi:Protein of unknown function (DUF2851)